MTSQYERDSQHISRISFDDTLNQKTKNSLCAIIEKRMAEEEQKELDGKGTGYYENTN